MSETSGGKVFNGEAARAYAEGLSGGYATGRERLHQLAIAAAIDAAVAGERERIRQLAIMHAAYTTEDHPNQRDTVQPFADLI